MKVWTTEDVPRRESFAFWNDAVSDAFLKVHTLRNTRSPFRGRILSRTLSTMAVNLVNAESHLVRRDHAMLARDTGDWFYVNLQINGRATLTQCGREQAVLPGDMCLLDGTRPFDLGFSGDMDLACFIVSRGALMARIGDAADLIARPIPGTGAGRILRAYASSLSATVSALPSASHEEIADGFVSLLALALNEGRGDAAPTGTRAALFTRACAYIMNRLCDPSLSLGAIAAGIGVAPRTLQAMFAQRETNFSAFLMEQRLQLAHRLLSRDAAMPVTEVAYSVGFSDLSHFSRCFRRRFGIAPSRSKFGSPPEGL